MSDLPVRFCPECGHAGSVSHDKIRCCPEGDNARYVPQSVAMYEQVMLRYQEKVTLE